MTENNMNLSTQVTQPGVNQLEQYVALSEGKKVREIEFNDLELICKISLFKSFVNAGCKPVSDEEMVMLIKELYNDCKEFYPSVTGDEIQEAMKRGSKGIYGEVFGINPKAWNEWIPAFLKHETRLLALKKKETHPEMTDEEKTKAKISFSNLIYSMYLSHCRGVDILDHYAINSTYYHLIAVRLIGSEFDEDLTTYAVEIFDKREKMKANKADRLKGKKIDEEINCICRGLRVKQAFTKMHETKYFNLLEFLKTKI